MSKRQRLGASFLCCVSPTCKEQMPSLTACEFFKQPLREVGQKLYGVPTKHLSRYLNWFLFLQKIKESTLKEKELAKSV